MTERILFVDDEPNILDTFLRNLRRAFDVATAEGPEQGLLALEGKGPFAVVVSDLRMPGMDGITFLEHVRQRMPDAVRIILSGHGDFATAVASVNRGAVFRFLTKPCPPEELVGVLRDALRQHRLVVAERELLRGTLRGSVQVLTDVLALVNPEAFGRSERIRDLVVKMGARLDAKPLWQLELAAMLCQLGCVALPPETLRKRLSGEALNAEEQQIWGMHPEIAANLLTNIPRLGEVADMIGAQQMPPGPDVPLGARILRAALDYDAELRRGLAPVQAVAALRTTPERYDPAVLDALAAGLAAASDVPMREVPVAALRPGMVLARDLVNTEGAPLLLAGQRVSDASITRLRNLSDILNVDGNAWVVDGVRKGAGT
ncbi:HD domain-containing phosphohydrolase [Nitratidesulfovibrio liaohensis]|uniref:Response regulator n=1 Tax=Nitratidesulfovibrio liaohensis TaxID=2604158 RepID=A0ABY9QX87_9BACT|nr:HD domain-containing phosphohydrolase [Nitratidesulfovibrio liaohensis]WMW64131.1 response regulator [Nitratidesulfovibrio liaohensis]